MKDANTILIKVPLEDADDMCLLWRDLRVADELQADFELGASIQSENFDGAALAEWIVPLSDSITPLLMGIMGFLIARRGELEVTRNGQTIKMKNLRPSQLKEIIELIDQGSDGS